MTTWRSYWSNAFWLMLPVLAVDVLFTAQLPAPYLKDFWSDIPAFVTVGENMARMLVIGLPIFMSFSLRTRKQKIGLVVYLTGLVLYGASWAMAIIAPQSTWASSAFGFSAMAYTPLVWLTGIGLMGDSFYFRGIPYGSWAYIALAVIFTSFHTYHTLIVYGRVFGAR